MIQEAILTHSIRRTLLAGVFASTLVIIPGAALALTLAPRLSSVLFGALLVLVAAQLTYRAVRAQRKA